MFSVVVGDKAGVVGVPPRGAPCWPVRHVGAGSFSQTTKPASSSERDGVCAKMVDWSCCGTRRLEWEDPPSGQLMVDPEHESYLGCGGVSVTSSSSACTGFPATREFGWLWLSGSRSGVSDPPVACRAARFGVIPVEPPPGCARIGLRG